jgi:hypothetical protein
MAETTACDSSLNAGEMQFGSAPMVHTWLALEYRGAWERDAVEGSSLPSTIKTLLKNLDATLPRLRVQLIRQPERRSGLPFRMYVARSTEAHCALYQFDLADYHDIAFINFARLYAGEIPDTAIQVAEPLTLVCTHGKRDVCCAVHGTSVYQALRAELGDVVWQTSHIGGHRFAGTLVTLPDGIYYGRVHPSDTGTLVNHIRERTISVSHLRGRSTLPDFAQAAEYFVRRDAPEGGASQFSHADFEQVSESATRVRFTMADGTSHAVIVQRTVSEFVVQTDSSKPESRPVTQFARVPD